MYNDQVLEQESVTGDIFLWFEGGKDTVFLISYSFKALPCLYKTSVGRITQESLKKSGKDCRDKQWLYKYYYDSFPFSPAVLF